MLKKLLKIKFLGIATFILLQSSSYGLQIENYVYDKQITYEDNGYHELTIVNDSSLRNRYKIIVTAEEEKNKFNIEIYPKVIFLEPYSSKKVKVLIRQKDKLEEKEYDFKIAVNPIQVPTRDIQEVESGVGIDGEVGLGITVPIKGYVGNLGNLKEDVKFNNFSKSNDGKIVSFDLINDMKRSAKIIAKVNGNTRNKSKSFYYLERGKKEGITSYKLETDFEIKDIKIYDGMSKEVLYEKKI